MLDVYLPVAGIHVGLIGLCVIGVITGILASAFGVGGTFFSIPILTLLGVPSAVAISSSASQMVASSSTLNSIYWRNGMVDLKMALITFVGSVAGVWVGSKLFAYLNSINQTNTALAFIYVFVLGSVAIFMFQESFRAIKARRRGETIARSDAAVNLLRKLPFHVYLEKSNVEISVLVPITLGFIASITVSLAGVGGGFLVIPALVYVVKLPTSMALGTSNFIGFGTVTVSAFMQAIFSKTIDIVLVAILIVSSVIGVRVGARIYKLIPPEELRLILSLLMFGLIFKFSLQIFIKPSELFSFRFMYW